MEMSSASVNEWYKTALISLLVGACFLITYYFHVILHTEVVFTHFFYIPIIIAAIWWKRKAFIVTSLLALFLVVTQLYVSLNIPFEDLVRIFMFFFVTAVVVLLSEQMEKSTKKLEKSEKKFRSVVESAKEAIITLSDTADVVSWNDGAKRIFGYSDEEMIGQSITKIMPEKYNAAFKASISKYDSSKPMAMDKMPELTALRKNGEEFPIDISVVHWEVEDELFFTSIIRDITARKQSENALKEISYRNRLILDSVGEGIYGVDSEGRITFFNSFAESITGYTAEEIIGKESHDLMHHTKKDGSRYPVEECAVHHISLLQGERIRIIDDIFWKKDGTSFPVDFTTTPIIENDEVKGAVVVFHDITSRKEMEMDLVNSEEKFREVFNKVNDMITLIEIQENGQAGNYLEVNDVACAKLRYSREEMMQMSPRDIGMRGEVDPSQIKQLLETGKLTFERTYITKNGEKIPVEINSHIFKFKGEKVALSVARDITDRKNAEKAILASENRYRTLFDISPEFIILISKEGTILDVNERVLGLSEFNKDNLIGTSLFDVHSIYNKDIQLYKQILADLIEGKEVDPFESKLIDYNEKTHNLKVYAKNFKLEDQDAILIVADDITFLKNAEKELKLSLQEKEMLLKEIYHRVKNNLMVISSLLSLQSRFIKDKAALDVFKESQNRAKSMALIHEKLYRSTDLKRMNFGEYIRTLTTDLFHTYVQDPSKVDLKLNVENVMLDINTSVPLGLIVNELVTNSMKHAFPEGKSGEIVVELHLKDDTYSLIVADNGSGFPKDIDFHQTKSLGLQLVNSLTDQINGNVELDDSKGTKFIITFKEEKYDQE